MKEDQDRSCISDICRSVIWEQSDQQSFVGVSSICCSLITRVKKHRVIGFWFMTFQDPERLHTASPDWGMFRYETVYSSLLDSLTSFNKILLINTSNVFLNLCNC